MTVYTWLSAAVTILALSLLIVGGIFATRRRLGVKSRSRDGWLTDQMVREIIERGTLTGGEVPEDALDLEEIAKEEERFWSETWDEPDHYWE